MLRLGKSKIWNDKAGMSYLVGIELSKFFSFTSRSLNAVYMSAISALVLFLLNCSDSNCMGNV